VILAVPFEEEDPEAGALLRAFFEKSLRYLEMNLISTLLVPGVSEKGEILEKADRLKEAYDLGRRLARL
jgi:hypothetical protein